MVTACILTLLSITGLWLIYNLMQPVDYNNNSQDNADRAGSDFMPSGDSSTFSLVSFLLFVFFPDQEKSSRLISKS